MKCNTLKSALLKIFLYHLNGKLMVSGPVELESVGLDLLKKLRVSQFAIFTFEKKRLYIENALAAVIEFNLQDVVRPYLY